MRLKDEDVSSIKDPVYSFELEEIKKEKQIPDWLLNIAMIRCNYRRQKKRWWTKKKKEVETSFYFQLSQNKKGSFSIGFEPCAGIVYLLDTTEEEIKAMNQALDVFKKFIINESPYRNQLILQSNQVVVNHLQYPKKGEVGKWIEKRG